MLSFRTGNQNRGRDDEVHAPELLMACDVLGWDSARTLVERFFIAGLFFTCEFTFGMSEKIGAVAAQSKHEKQLGVQAWRADLSCG